MNKTIIYPVLLVMIATSAMAATVTIDRCLTSGEFFISAIASNGDTVLITDDIVNESRGAVGACFNLNRGVTLDCQGHTLTVNTGSSDGVITTSTGASDEMIVKNCIINDTGLLYGVKTDGLDVDLTIQNTTFYGKNGIWPADLSAGVTLNIIDNNFASLGTGGFDSAIFLIDELSAAHTMNVINNTFGTVTSGLFYIADNAGDTNIQGNTFSSSVTTGIKNDGGTLSGDWTIYNNKFATDTPWSSGLPASTIANQSLLEQPNVMGGCYLAGNAYIGTGGYSLTCTDADGDRVCDSGTTIQGITDEAPLTSNDTVEACTYCEPSWVCSGYGECQFGDYQECNAVTDENSCGEEYTGDYSEFSTQNCDWNTDTSSSTQYACDDAGNCQLYSVNGYTTNNNVQQDSTGALLSVTGSATGAPAWIQGIINWFTSLGWEGGMLP